jgi:hypothetical protein
MEAMDGYVALWRGVIMQALMDATGQAYGEYTEFEKRCAYRWLTRNGKEFQMVCALALLDPEYVTTRTRSILSHIRGFKPNGRNSKARKRRIDRAKLAHDIALLAELRFNDRQMANLLRVSHTLISRERNGLGIPATRYKEELNDDPDFLSQLKADGLCQMTV